MKIFLSYSWKNKVEADYIDRFFCDKDYTVLRDIREVFYKGDLSGYSKYIRQCDAAFALISDAYLKSDWCMFEIIQLMKEQNFEEKIFPVILDDARVFTPEDRTGYTRYWEDKFTKLNQKTDGIECSSSLEIDQDLRTYTYIKTDIPTAGSGNHSA